MIEDIIIKIIIAFIVSVAFRCVCEILIDLWNNICIPIFDFIISKLR